MTYVTEVVHALPAVVAVSTGHTGFDRHALPDSALRTVRGALDNLAGRLVAENHGRLDHKVADAAVFEVVYVGSLNGKAANRGAGKVERTHMPVLLTATLTYFEGSSVG